MTSTNRLKGIIPSCASMQEARGNSAQTGDMLAASDVEQNRLNDIGKFRQSQYNTALDQTLNTLTGLRQQDANNLLGIGGFQRNLDYQTKQAPFNAYQVAVGAMDPFIFQVLRPRRSRQKSLLPLVHNLQGCGPIVGSLSAGGGGQSEGLLERLQQAVNAGDILWRV